MVDRVELALLDQVGEVGHFQHGKARGLQQQRDARDQAVQVRDVRQDVVGEDQVGHAAFIAQLLGERAAEEGVEGRHAGGDRGLRGRPCRIDPQDRHAARDEVAQQVAVVAGDLDHQRAGIEAKPKGQLLGVGARVRQQRAGDRREVRVVAAEQQLGRHGLGDLHQAAGLAQHEVERRGHIGRLEIRLDQQPVGERRPAEREDRCQRSAAAGAAGALGPADHDVSSAWAGSRAGAAGTGWRQRRLASIRPSASSCRM